MRSMITRTNWFMSQFMLLLLAGAAPCTCRADGRSVEPVSVCEVLNHPATYAGKTVKITVRILSTKEGASLWSPECREMGV
jgi:hypothetical protein